MWCIAGGMVSILFDARDMVLVWCDAGSVVSVWCDVWLWYDLADKDMCEKCLMGKNISFGVCDDSISMVSI